tara:strand:- start:243 stop:716 length:474 start_codon:yes stop_codon:yes gene_type:complete
MKKVILIDPFNQTVEMKHVPTDQESFDYKSLLEMMECSLLDVVPLGGDVIMFVDDEGLLKDNRYFALADVPYAGRAILAGESDEDGNSQSVPITVDQVQEHLTWKPEGHKEEPYMSFTYEDESGEIVTKKLGEDLEINKAASDASAEMARSSMKVVK